MELDYSLICEEVPDYRDFSLDEFKQAMLCVLSRIFTSYNEEGQKIEALVPFADMANHSEDPDVTYSFCPRR